MFRCTNGEAIYRHSAFGALRQEPGSTALQCQAVETAGGAVRVRVAGAEDRSDEKSIHNIGKDLDTKLLHRNDVRRCCGSRAGPVTSKNLCQSRVVVWKNDADTEGTANEEQAEPPVNRLEGVFDVDAWALGLGSDHADVLGPDDDE